MKPPEPFSEEWCAVAGREHNPHCKTISVPIDGAIFQIILVILIITYLKWKNN